MTDLTHGADTRTDLGVFHDPRSVAVVGASANPAKWGYWLAQGALAGRSRRRVYLVNSRGGEILGVPAAKTLRDLAEVPELVAFCVPPAQVWRVADEALGLGVRGLLGITAEVPQAAELAARVTAAGARLVGPSSLGLFDAATCLQLAWGNFLPGTLAIVSQSGQLGSEIALLAERAGIGVSRFVSAGSQLDVTIADLLNDLAGHKRSRAVALYLEDFTDGRRIFDAVAALRAVGKPVVLLTAGGSAAGQRAARSHTGALTSPVEFVDAACRAAGALRAQTPAELVHIVAYLLAGAGRGEVIAPAGPRVGVISDSGGQGAVAADCLSRRGLAVPELTGVQPALADLLPAAAATGNPVDLAGAGEHDLGSYRKVTAALLASGEVDSVLLTGYFGRYALDSPTLAAAELQVAGQLGTLVRRTGRPLVVHSMGADGGTATVLRDAGIPVYDTVEAAAEALSAAVALGHRPVSTVALGSSPVRPTGARTAPAAQPTGRADRTGGTAQCATGYWAARELLQEAGIAFPAASQVSDLPTVVAAVARLAAPYVLKAGWLEHKTESGGLVTGLADGAAVTRAFTELHQRLGDGPYVLEEQDTRRDVVEMIIGAHRETGLGPMVTVGAGGTEAELYRDAVTECAPVDLAHARNMIGRLRCTPLLTGWRGRPAADIESLARAVVAISELVTRLPAGIAELEINPIRVAAAGAIAVDALLVPAEPGHADGRAGQ